MRLLSRTLGPVALALALLVPVASAGAATERTVSVEASATLKVPNDTASLGFSVSRERKTRGAALRAVSASLADVIAAVQATPGVGAGDVRTGRISVRKSLHGKQTVFRAAEGIGVTLHQPDRAGELVAAAIAAGATGVSGPNFFVGDTEAAASSALAAAFAKAKSKAATLAAAAGATLGPALVIDEGGGAELVPQSDQKAASAPACGVGASPTTKAVSPQASSSACTTAPPPTKPGSSTVTATVGVIFALQ